MKFTIVKTEDGKYAVKSDFDGSVAAGESYDADFPFADVKDTVKAEKAEAEWPTFPPGKKTAEELSAVDRFHANEQLRKSWFDGQNLNKLNAADSPEYKAALNKFVSSRRNVSK